ncbi:hypothetical protein [Sediminibacillus terrae]|uniref:hypothetical protein n=1 Tax=Sediminibacillus terrae TaxID=1562106 RepID=UPI00192A2475|nr:hypothetical protein [Sediminibacillus terrae]
MKQFDELPKSVKKTVRYILQDTEAERLLEIEKLFSTTISRRKKLLKKKSDINE